MKSGWAWVLPAALVLGGCTPTAPPTTSPPTPTFLCTPEAGGAESPCSQQDYEKMKARDAQYEEAEKVYREYQAEYERVIRAGGANSLTPKLEQILGTAELRKSLLQQLRDFKSQGLRIDGPGIQIKTVKREPSREMKGSTIAMTFCIDSSSTKVLKGKQQIRVGGIAKETAYFVNQDSRWEIVATTFKEVDSCD